MSNLLTNSRLSCFRACPKRHWFRYERGLAPEEDSRPLRIGRAFHAAKQAMDLDRNPEAAITELGILDPYDTALVAAMVCVHGEHYEHERPEVVATELAFEMPVVNPDTGATTPVWRLAGVIDRIYRLASGVLVLGDYKTTTEDISSGSDYWTRLLLDQQMSIYVIAARSLGYDVQSILYDVTVRPMHRPLLATPPDKVRLKKDGTPYANTRMRDETPAEYAVRVADAMRADPDRYFARHEIARLEDDLDEARAEIWMQQLAIREAQRSGRWWRNPGSCVNPYHCDYLTICRAHDMEVPPGFIKLKDVHPELAIATEPGLAGSATVSGPSDTNG